MDKKLIKNFDTLATNKQRQDALTIAEAGLQAIDTEVVLRNSIELDGTILRVAGQRFDLSRYEHTYVIGFGKVACTAAYTLEQILKDRIKDGAVVGLSERVCQTIDTYAGTHPIPSAQNYTASKHIEEVARSAKENDLVIVIVSGGGSALLCSTMGECDQGQKLFNAFLQSGGTIEELNTVRKHISKLKGGGLAKALYPATVISLIFSDVPGGGVIGPQWHQVRLVLMSRLSMMHRRLSIAMIWGSSCSTKPQRTSSTLSASTTSRLFLI